MNATIQLCDINQIRLHRTFGFFISANFYDIQRELDLRAAPSTMEEWMGRYLNGSHVFPQRPFHPIVLNMLRFMTLACQSTGEVQHEYRTITHLLLELPRVSDTNPENVAYLPSVDNPNKWTSIRPRKYVRSFFERHGLKLSERVIEWITTSVAHLTSHAIDELRNILAQEQVPPNSILHRLRSEIRVLDITRDTVDELARACHRLCPSCMTHGIDSYPHPWCVYSPERSWAMVVRTPRMKDLAPLGITGESLAHAILNDGDTVYAARVLVHRDTRSYVRIYGPKKPNEDYASPGDKILEDWLDAHGYERSDDWNGARVDLIQDDGQIVMPYIDGENHCVDVCSDYVRVGAGYKEATGTLGFLDDLIDTVEGFYDEEDTIEVNYRRPNGSWYSAIHWNQSDAIQQCDYGPSEDEYRLDDDVVTICYDGMDGYAYVGDCVRDHADDWILMDDAVELHDGEYAIRSECVRLSNHDWALKDDAVVTHDSDWELKDECVELHDGRWALEDEAYEWSDGTYHLEEEPEAEDEDEPTAVEEGVR